jgi:hypothetical protein
VICAARPPRVLQYGEACPPGSLIRVSTPRTIPDSVLGSYGREGLDRPGHGVADRIAGASPNTHGRPQRVITTGPAPGTGAAGPCAGRGRPQLTAMRTR